MFALAKDLHGRADREGENLADPERPLDLVHLARQTDGDESLEAELLAIFERQCDKQVGRLGLTDLPRRARGDVAHLLKGSSLAIGAFAAARAAGALESAFAAEGPEPKAEIAAFETAVAAARAAIADLRR